MQLATQLELSPESFEQQVQAQQKRTKSSKSRWLIVLASIFVAFFYDGLLGLIVPNIPPPLEAQNTQPSRLWVFLLLSPFVLTLLIAIHEAGHLLAGWLVGYRFIKVTVGMIGLRREIGGLRFWRVGENPINFQGIAMAMPTSARRLRWRSLALVCGGPLANLLLLILLIVIGRTFYTVASSHWFAIFYHSLLVFNTAIVIANLIPQRVGTLLSDTARVIQILRGGAQLERHLRLDLFLAHNYYGVQLAAADQVDLDPLLLPADNSPEELTAQCMAFDHAMRDQDGQAAAQHMNRMLAILCVRPELQTASALSSAALFEVRYGRGAETARQWLRLRPISAYNTFQIEADLAYLLAEANILLAEGKQAEARAVAERGLLLNNRRIDIGWLEVEKAEFQAIITEAGDAPLSAVDKEFQQLTALPGRVLPPTVGAFQRMQYRQTPGIWQRVASPLLFLIICFGVYSMWERSLIGGSIVHTLPKVAVALFSPAGTPLLSGYYHALQGKDAEAIVAFSQAIAHSPDLQVAYQWRAKLYLRLDLYGPAIADYERLLDENDVPSVQAHRRARLGELYMIWGLQAQSAEEYGISIDAYSQALSYPLKAFDLFNVYFQRAVAYVETGRYQEAESDLQSAMLVDVDESLKAILTKELKTLLEQRKAQTAIGTGNQLSASPGSR